MKGSPTSPIFFLLLAAAFFRVATWPCSGQPLRVAGDDGDSCGSDHLDLETYIIHVRNPHGVAQFASPEKRLEWHRSFLPPAAPSGCMKPRMIYSYDSAIKGFAARLTREQLKTVKGMEGFLHAHREQVLSAQTTYTPEFLGLSRCLNGGLWQRANFGKGVIVGVVDTGIDPSHPSFRDHGLWPPPDYVKWRDRCGFSNPGLCNNKLIGAVSFLGGDVEDRSPFDTNGHGTHVAGTAAGMFAEEAQVMGQAAGTAAGTAPYAHLAVYKVCQEKLEEQEEHCLESDILAGIDQAIHDGVDVMSISLGRKGRHLCDDPIAIGSLAAVEKGIFVSCAAGNSGPFHMTVANDAPWILTVGASTTDRAIRATLHLASEMAIEGEAIYQPGGFDHRRPHLLAYPGASGVPAMEFCEPGSLDGIDVREQFVMCSLGGNVSPSEKGEVVSRAGGAAVVLMNQEADGFTVQAELVDFPAIQVSYADSQVIRQYSISQIAPRATLEFRGTTVGEPNSPAIASFSSRGPSLVNNGGILKPDIVGPGVNVLAAKPSLIEPYPSVDYAIMSGTSMAAPHLSGVAALLKSAHKLWSPAAIKSAIMTTSDVANSAGRPIADQLTGNPADAFAMGAGHVNPARAAEPGLVYDLHYGDYISYVCTLGLTEKQLEAVARQPVDCSGPVSSDHLNYPSLSAVMSPYDEKVLTRTLTYIGNGDKVLYRAEVVEPEGVTVRVQPTSHVFKRSATKLSFRVTLTTGEPTAEFSSGVLRWISSNGPVVASPIVVLSPPAVGSGAGGLAQLPCSPSNVTMGRLGSGANDVMTNVIVCARPKPVVVV